MTTGGSLAFATLSFLSCFGRGVLFCKLAAPAAPSKATAIYKSEKATVEDRRLLLSYVFSDLSFKAGNIRPNYTLAFEFLKEWVPTLNNTFELEEKASTEGQKDDSKPLCSTMLPVSVPEF
jgi:hypothetical protein